MLKTFVIGAAALFLATSASLANVRDVQKDLNGDGQISVYELQFFYTDRDSRNTAY